MPEEIPEGQSPQTARKQRHARYTVDWWIDVFAKFATSFVLGILTVTASCQATSIQSKISGATLLSEREKAESSLRADMFKSLIAPILGPQQDKAISPKNERLLVELLALNFHENFELKPLFERADQRLASEGIKEMGEKQAQRARRSLKSIARRIIDRQIAALRKEGHGPTAGEEGACDYKESFMRLASSWIRGTSEGPGACIYELTIVQQPKNNEQCRHLLWQYRGVAVTQQPNNTVGCAELKKDEFKEELIKRRVYVLNDMSSTDLIQDLTSPDKQHRLTMVVTDPKWDRQEFTVELYDILREHPYRLLPITTTWADLPLTDNTLFADGNRVALSIYRVHDNAILKTATLKVIWFPRDYFTPRERPLDYGEFLKLVGKKK